MPRSTGITKNVSPRTGAVTWTVRWREPGGTDALGRNVRRQREQTFARKADAEAHLAETRLEKRDGPRPRPSAETLAAHGAAWFRRLARSGKTEGTQARYASIWRTHILPVLGATPLRDLTPSALQDLLDGVTDRGRKPATVLGVRVVLRMVLEAAVEDGKLPANPCARVRVPGRVKATPAHWTRDQVRVFEQGTTDDRDGPLWTVLLRTGLRLGEALALRWADLDLGRGTARVVRTLAKTLAGPDAIREGAKTRASHRTVALMPEAVAALKRQRTLVLALRLAAPAWAEGDLVFPGQTGRPRCPENVGRRLDTAAKRLGVPRITPHGCRHTAATLALEAGVPMAVVQQMLGHSSITMTMDLYSHVSPDLAARGAAMLGDYLEGAGG